MKVFHALFHNRIWVLLPTLFLSSLSLAQIKKNLPNTPISDEYLSGEYLIYDCQKGHFACISSVNFEFCEKQYSLTMGSEEMNLPCRPLKKHKDLEECLKTQQRLVNTLRGPDLCLKENLTKLSTHSK